MLFSTKAEYGVRLMIELGRRTDGASPEEATPVSLTAVAEAENLPLSYLEHLVAKLRQAGLVTSVRGAHGGYRLAKEAADIPMLDVVQALEGPIAPMECFHSDREGRVQCSHEIDPDPVRDEAPVDTCPRWRHEGPLRYLAGRARQILRRPDGPADRRLTPRSPLPRLEL